MEQLFKALGQDKGLKTAHTDNRSDGDIFTRLWHWYAGISTSVKFYGHFRIYSVKRLNFSVLNRMVVLSLVDFN